MPMQYVEPEVAFEVTGPDCRTWIIYHTYKNDNFDQGRNSFWYTTDAGESEEYEFDIRRMFFTPCHLDKELTPIQRVADNAHKLVLQMALDRCLASFNDIGEVVFNEAKMAQ